jgi:hypothetical protein
MAICGSKIWRIRAFLDLAKARDPHAPLSRDLKKCGLPFLSILGRLYPVSKIIKVKLTTKVAQLRLGLAEGHGSWSKFLAMTQQRQQLSRPT